MTDAQHGRPGRPAVPTSFPSAPHPAVAIPSHSRFRAYAVRDRRSFRRAGRIRDPAARRRRGAAATMPPSLAALDQATGGALGRLFAAGDFSGKKDETALVYPPGPAARVLLVGLGKVDESRARASAAPPSAAAKRARSLGVPRAAFHLARRGARQCAPAEAGQAIAEGLAQGAWQYNEMKRPPEDQKPRSSGSTSSRRPPPAAIDSRDTGSARRSARDRRLARGIQVLPGNVCTPSYVARTAEEIGQAPRLRRRRCSTRRRSCARGWAR